MIEELLQMLVKKVKTVKGPGTIDDHFKFMGRDYVVSRIDPYSNYLPFKRNDLGDITNPFRKILVDLAYGLAYKK